MFLASQRFLASQGQKRTYFNSIIRLLIYHKYKRRRFSSRQERGVTRSSAGPYLQQEFLQG